MTLAVTLRSSEVQDGCCLAKKMCIRDSASTVAEVNGLFVQWWRANWTEGTTTRNELLERWFGTVLDDGRLACGK